MRLQRQVLLFEVAKTQSIRQFLRNFVAITSRKAEDSRVGKPQHSRSDVARSGAIGNGRVPQEMYSVLQEHGDVDAMDQVC